MRKPDMFSGFLGHLKENLIRQVENTYYSR